MKHSVIFQGKKYISSKRASKISGYSSDYVGQLCRAQKLDARMFGRTWYVAEDSLSLHMVTSTSAETFRNRARNFQGTSQTEKFEQTPFSISAKEAAELTGYSSDYIGQLCRGGKIEARMIGHTWFVTKESLYAYQTNLEQEQRAAEYQKLTRQAQTRSRKSSVIQSNFSVKKSFDSVEVSPLPKSSHPVRTAVLAFSLIAIVAVGSMSVVYVGGGGNVAVNNSSVAGVYLAAKSVVDFFQRGYDAIVARIIKSRGLTVRNSDDGSASGLEYGMAVSPSTGDPAVDAERIAAIKNNFSDEVEVHPDQSGTAGIITPVFRKSNGTNFTYVLVPVKKHGASP